MTIVVSETLPFDYELIFSAKRRSVQLAIAQGQLKVRAPKGTPRLFVHQLLLQKQAWVLKHLQANMATLKPDWVDRKQILMGGELFDFSWQLAVKGKVVLSERNVHVQVPVRVTAARRERYIRQLLQGYLTDKARAFFQAKVQQQALQMAVAPTAVRIGNWKRRWGCCDSRGEVGFNWRLLQAPEWVAHYVVVHELAHLRYMNHSTAFWQFVEEFFPDYPAAQSWLRKHQQELL